MATALNATGTKPHVADLLQALIRFDTTNPPGNERACAQYCLEVLNSVGIDAELMGNDDDRPNVVTRIRGRATHRRCYCTVILTWFRRWRNPGMFHPLRAAGRMITFGDAGLSI